MSVANFIFTYLKDKLPDINWNIGSTIRELIATPLVHLADSGIKALNSQVNSVSINSMIANPEQHRDSIEQVFNELELHVNNSITSAGKVTILTRSETPTVVLKNTSFYVGDYAVIVTQDTYPSATITNLNGYTPLHKLGYQSYAFEVPVEAATAFTYLPINTQLSWDEAPSDVYDIVVSAAVSGGRIGFSLYEKAQMIKDYLSPEILSLSAGITKTLRKALPNIVVDACYDTSTDIRSPYAENVFENGINKSYLYVKPCRAPRYEYVQVYGNKVGSEYVIDTHIIGIIDVVEIKQNAVSLPMRDLEIHNNNIRVKVTTETSDKMFTLKIYRMADADIIQNFLDGYTAGSPYYIEIKAPATFDMILDFTYTGQELSTQDYATLCSRIQSLALNTNFSDSNLSAILNELGATMVGTGSYTLYTHNDSCYRQQHTTATYYSLTESSYAIYLGATNIHAKYI